MCRDSLFIDPIRTLTKWLGTFAEPRVFMEHRFFVILSHEMQPAVPIQEFPFAAPARFLRLEYLTGKRVPAAAAVFSRSLGTFLPFAARFKLRLLPRMDKRR